ncbi:response regulator [Sphingomonas koreensis]|nr:response regulator [Sphingomonas koreensis]
MMPGSEHIDKAVQVPRRVYVIDDDADVRKSLHFLLATSSVTALPFAEASAFLEQVAMLAPAPILLDLRMPRVDGLQVLAILKDRVIDWPVAVMTAHGDVSLAARAMELGAIEFLEKPFLPATLDQVLTHAFGLLERACAQDTRTPAG